MIGATVGTAGIVHGIGTGIDGNVGQGPAGVGEHDQVTGDKVCVCGIRIRVLGDTAACGIGKVGQTCFPCPHAGGGVGAAIHGGRLNCIRNPRGINPLDIGKVIVPVVGNKRGAHKTAGFKGSNVRRAAGECAGIGYSFITVQERRVVIVSDVRQHFRGIGVYVGGGVLGNIQPAVILHFLDIVAGVLQSSQDIVVVHLVRDQAHIRHECDPIGIYFQKIVWEIIIHGQAVGIGPVRVIRILSNDRVWGDNESGFFLILGRRICRFRWICRISCIRRILRLCFRLGFGGSGCFLRCFGRNGGFLRFYRFCRIRCFGGNRFRCICRLSYCGFAAAHDCCRHCLRGKPQDQNDGQQKRKQPFADWFQIQFHPSWVQNKPPHFQRRLWAIFSCRYYP